MNKTPPAFGVVILAAGASTRMGRCKLLLPWGERTILAHLLHQWRRAGAAQIVPVIDPSNQLLREALADAGFSRSGWIENSSPQLGMFSSLREASRWTGWLPTLTHFAVCLGDQPHIQFSTLRRLLDAARKNPTRICQPALHGRGGHPIVLPANNFRELAQRNVPNLRAYVRIHEALRLRLPVEDPGVSEDLNTLEDYAHWKPQECSKSDRVQSIPVLALCRSGCGTLVNDSL
ncbi:MAG: nucleotidyltransferase family protein, partial [Candidatus Udaeobacter sp.]